MDKRDYIRLAIAESSDNNGGTPDDQVTLADDSIPVVESMASLTPATPTLPYPPAPVVYQSTAGKEAGKLVRALISGRALKQRRKANRPNWRQL